VVGKRLGNQATRVKGDGKVHPKGAAAELSGVVERGRTVGNVSPSRAETLRGEDAAQLADSGQEAVGQRNNRNGEREWLVVDAGPFFVRVSTMSARHDGHRLELGSQRVTKTEKVGC
jgi:hypothetical protein